jgi:hypothetical protein
MLFVGLRQDSSLLHYWSRRKLHPVTAIGTTHEWSPLFSANPDLATCLAPGAGAMSSPFGIMTLEVSVLAVWVATTVYSTVTVLSPISDSSSLPTHMIGIRTTTMDTPTIIPIMTTVIEYARIEIGDRTYAGTGCLQTFPKGFLSDSD